MSWIKRNWWLTPAALVVAFDVWAFLAQLGVVGGTSYEPRTNVRFIAAAVWLAFAAVAGGVYTIAREAPNRSDVAAI